jgi:hypothetical protein
MGKRKKSLIAVWLCVLLFTRDALAYTETPLTDVIRKLAELLKNGALVLGWGFGFCFVVNGIRDLANSGSDDIQMKRRGSNRLCGGIAMIGGERILAMVMSYLGINA